ncbi:MAG: benzoate/H(+) symporter BenE family transporter [Vogesella sp.]|jgi:benzoate membrane transport protein|uniref:benzoate/H(+) symporter BenE family transporter n=1 Tax=Vogesella sp. TaxID=1904252 RepID=UPI0011CADC5C
MLKHLPPSTLIAGVLTIAVGYTGPFLIIVHAAQQAGLSAAELASWLWAVSIGSGVVGLWLSWRWKMPIITAWSTPGAALLLAALPTVSYPEAVGGYVIAGLLVWLIGISGAFDALMKRFPPALAAALLAGILFRFVAELVPAVREHAALVLPMALMFFAGRRLWPRYALMGALALGGVFLAATGGFAAAPSLANSASGPLWTTPVFTLAGLSNIALPLTLIALTGQFLPGMAVLKNDGYDIPARVPVSALGGVSALLAPFGCHGVVLAAITAAMCTGPEAHPDRTQRWKAGVVAACCYILVALLGGALVALLLVLPKALVMAAAALALFGTLASSLSAALASDTQREAALLTFVVAASGVSFAGIGAPLWALLAGVAVSLLLRWQLPKPATGATSCRESRAKR